MSLKKPKGDMYTFVNFIWNPVSGKCPYQCSYCYVARTCKRFEKDQKPLHLDERELRVNLGAGNFIFVCSGCDLFHPNVSERDYARVVAHAREYQDNRYLLHTKNPSRVLELAHKGYSWPGGSVVCVTVESDIWYSQMGNAPVPFSRLNDLARISGEKMVTIEPVMDFNIMTFSELIQHCKPSQVNIGADSGHNHLIEPNEGKLLALIEELKPFTKVHLKKNLRRLLPEHQLYSKESRA